MAFTFHPHGQYIRNMLPKVGTRFKGQACLDLKWSAFASGTQVILRGLVRNKYKSWAIICLFWLKTSGQRLSCVKILSLSETYSKDEPGCNSGNVSLTLYLICVSQPHRSMMIKFWNSLKPAAPYLKKYQVLYLVTLAVNEWTDKYFHIKIKIILLKNQIYLSFF